MHSTKTSHVSEKDLLVALSAAQSSHPGDSASSTRNEGKQTTPEGGCPQRTNSHQRPRQRFAPFFSAWKHWSSNGRASRSEYWLGMLTLMVFLLPFSLLFPMGLFALVSDYLVPALVPLVCVSAFLPLGCWMFLSLVWTSRRLHDCGNSSWVLLLGFLPFGGLVILFLCLRPSEPGTNRYGEVPYLEP